MKKYLFFIITLLCSFRTYAQTTPTDTSKLPVLPLVVKSPTSIFDISPSAGTPITPLVYFVNTNGQASTEFRVSSAFNNLSFGFGAGRYLTTGSNNNFMGYKTGFNTTSGSANNFFGFSAGQVNTSGSDNNFFGHYNGAANITGSDNNFIGHSAGSSNVVGSSNNFLGNHAGFSNVDGDDNNFLGSYAGYLNTSGDNNIFQGNAAGYSNVSGNGNNFFGFKAGNSNTDGDGNMFLGAYTGTGNTTGNGNAFIGYYTGQMNITGENNSVLGANANSGITGNENIVIGYKAGATGPVSSQLTYGSGNIIIGDQSGIPNGAIDDQLSIGNLIYGTGLNGTGNIASTGKIGIGTFTPHANLEVEGAMVYGGPAANLDPAVGKNPLAFLGNGSAKMIIGINRTGYEGEFDFIANKGIGNNGGFAFYQHDEDGTDRELIKFKGSNGFIGIGTTNPDEKLQVNGTVHAKEVKVNLENFPDYVFKRSYNLSKLSAVKTFIAKYHRLPEMPSEEQVLKDGLNLGQINKLLVQKVEELTLYLIEKDAKDTFQNNELVKQKQINQSLEDRLNKLQAQIESMAVKSK